MLFWKKRKTKVSGLSPVISHTITESKSRVDFQLKELKEGVLSNLIDYCNKNESSKLSTSQYPKQLISPVFTQLIYLTSGPEELLKKEIFKDNLNLWDSELDNLHVYIKKEMKGMLALLDNNPAFYNIHVCYASEDRFVERRYTKDGEPDDLYQDQYLIDILSSLKNINQTLDYLLKFKESLLKNHSLMHKEQHQLNKQLFSIISSIVSKLSTKGLGIVDRQEKTSSIKAQLEQLDYYNDSLKS